MGVRLLSKMETELRATLQGLGVQPVLPAGPDQQQAHPAPEQGMAVAPSARVLAEALAPNLRSYRDLPVTFCYPVTGWRERHKSSLGLLSARGWRGIQVVRFEVGAQPGARALAELRTTLAQMLARWNVDTVPVRAFGAGRDETSLLVWLHDSGPVQLLECPQCRWAACTQGAPCAPPRGMPQEPRAPLSKVTTPGATTVAAVTQMLGVTADRLVKTLIYRAGSTYVAALVRGDHELDEAKLRRALGGVDCAMADPQEIARLTGGPVGFSGPVGLSGIRVFADHAVALMSDFVTGANEANAHLTGVNLGRDFNVDSFADLRCCLSGDPCLECGAPLRASRGFVLALEGALGDDALDWSVTAEDGSEVCVTCFILTIDLTVTLGAIAEANCGATGVLWPAGLAPFEVHLLLLDPGKPPLAHAAEDLLRTLEQEGYEVLLDDRDCRAGVKFHDSELFGIPYLVVLGRKLESDGVVEVRERRSGRERLVPLAEVSAALREGLR